MTDVLALVELGREALMLVVIVSLPIVAVAAVASALTAFLQTLVQVQDSTLAHLPRYAAVLLGLWVLAPWMGAKITTFAVRAFGG